MGSCLLFLYWRTPTRGPFPHHEWFMGCGHPSQNRAPLDLIFTPAYLSEHAAARGAGGGGCCPGLPGCIPGRQPFPVLLVCTARRPSLSWGSLEALLVGRMPAGVGQVPPTPAPPSNHPLCGRSIGRLRISGGG